MTGIRLAEEIICVKLLVINWTVRRKFALETGSAGSKVCQLVKQAESQFKKINILNVV